MLSWLRLEWCWKALQDAASSFPLYVAVCIYRRGRKRVSICAWVKIALANSNVQDLQSRRAERRFTEEEFRDIRRSEGVSKEDE